MLLSDLLQEFRGYLLTERAASPATVAAYTATVRRLLDFLESERTPLIFERITTAQLRRFVASLKGTGVSNATIARHVHALRSFWRFVVETYDLGNNAALPLRAPSPDHRLPRVLSAEECRQLLQAAEKNHYHLYRIRDRVLLKLLMQVGLRRSEVIAARIGDYDQSARTLTVVMSKGRKSRVVPLPGGLCADLNAWLLVRPAGHHDRLLTTRTGQPLTAKCLYRSLATLAKHAGLEHRGIGPHLLRHTAATLVLRNSGDLLATSRLLGHSSVAVTADTYCHLSNDDVRRAVNYHPLVQPCLAEGDGYPCSSAWDLPLPEDRRDLVARAEAMAATGLAEYRGSFSDNPGLMEAAAEYCVFQAIRHNTRQYAVIPAEVVRAVAWEGRVVEGYTMAEHVRLVALKDVLMRLDNLRQSEQPWSLLLPEIAGRLSSGPAPAPHPWLRSRLDEIGQAVHGPLRNFPPVRRFAAILAGIALLEAFADDNLLLAQVGANLSLTGGESPPLFFLAWDLPLLSLTLRQASLGDASALCTLISARLQDTTAMLEYLSATGATRR